MKLTELKLLNDWQRRRSDLISRHQYLEALRGDQLVNVAGSTVEGLWATIRPTALAHLRSGIESVEESIRALGVEVEPHFAPIEPPTSSSPLAEALTARGYNLVETGGGCTAWVRIMPDGEHIVVTSSDGGSEPTEADWLIGRWTDEEWETGYSKHAADNWNDTFDSVLSHVEGVSFSEHRAEG